MIDTLQDSELFSLHTAPSSITNTAFKMTSTPDESTKMACGVLPIAGEVHVELFQPL
jgi:hypothetical protein